MSVEVECHYLLQCRCGALLENMGATEPEELLNLDKAERDLGPTHNGFDRLRLFHHAHVNSWMTLWKHKLYVIRVEGRVFVWPMHKKE